MQGHITLETTLAEPKMMWAFTFWWCTHPTLSTAPLPCSRRLGQKWAALLILVLIQALPTRFKKYLLYPDQK